MTNNSTPESLDLRLDIGYAPLEDLSFNLKHNIPIVDFAKKTNFDKFSLPFKPWRVKLKGMRDGKNEYLFHKPLNRTSFEDEIIRERLLKANAFAAQAEISLGESRKQIESAIPALFSAKIALDRLKSQTSSWLKLFKEAIIHTKDSYNKALSEHTKAENSLSEFINSNSLFTKKPPANLGFWDRAASLIVMIILECLISMPTIAQHKGGQLILSSLISITVSIANVLIGILTGAVFIYKIKYAKSNKYKALFSFGAIISLLIMIVMNLAVSRYREGYETFSLAEPFPNTALSIVLFVIGIGVFLFSTLKGAREFSPGFPGHEQKWNEYVSTLNKLNDCKSRYLFLINQMRAMSEGKLENVRTIVQVIRTQTEIRKAGANKIEIDIQTSDSILSQNYAHINSSAHILLKLYRENAYKSFIKKSKNHSTNTSLASDFIHLSHDWPNQIPDSSELKTRVTYLLEITNKNLEELNTFEDKFEKEIAEPFQEEIDKITKESNTI